MGVENAVLFQQNFPNMLMCCVSMNTRVESACSRFFYCNKGSI